MSITMIKVMLNGYSLYVIGRLIMSITMIKVMLKGCYVSGIKIGGVGCIKS